MKLGNTYKDSITGYEGIATASVKYISGCEQTLISPKHIKGGFDKGEWFDNQRLLLNDNKKTAEVRQESFTGFGPEAPKR